MSLFKPLQVIWKSSQRAILEDIQRFNFKFNGRALKAVLPKSLPCRSANTKTGHLQERLLSLLAPTGSLDEKVLPLLRKHLSSRMKGILMAVRTDFFGQ